MSGRSAHYAALLVVLLAPGPVAAQDRVGSPADIAPGVVVRFREDGAWVKGPVTAVTADSVTMMFRDDPRVFALNEVDELAFSAGKKHWVVKGALVGAAAGALGAALVNLLETAMAESIWNGPVESSGGWAGVGATAAACAALGALSGLIFPAEQWVAVQVPRVQPIVAPMGNGVAIGMRLQL